MAKQNTTLHRQEAIEARQEAVEVPQEARSRPERSRWRYLAPLVGAAALFAASGASERISAQEDHSHGAEAPVAMAGVQLPASFEDSGMVSPQSELEQIAHNARNVINLDRSLADRLPDQVIGPQIHPIYIVPADGVDRQLDTNGGLERIIGHSQDWLIGEGRGDGLSLRVDSYEGHPDSSFFRSEKPNDVLKSMGTYMVYSLRDELWAKGFSSSSSKVLVAFYDGETNSACAAASKPANGNIAMINVTPRCFPAGIPELQDQKFSYFDPAIPHEVFHATGQVPDNAPNSNGNAHSTDATDLMRPSGGVENLKVDPGHDDYWNNILPWLTYNHFPVVIDIVGQGSVQSNTKPNKYLGIGEPSTSADGNMWFRANDEVSLIATPEDETWEFAGWSGGGNGEETRVITVGGKEVVLANFEPRVNINLRGRRAGGSFIRVAGRTACRFDGDAKSRAKAQSPPDAACHPEFKPGSEVKLTAVPAKGKKFIRWVGAASTKPLLKFIARHGQDKDLTAVYANVPVSKKLANKNK